jgi:hypothetical protein
VLPIRDAIDFVHGCIASTIKALKFSAEDGAISLQRPAGKRHVGSGQAWPNLGGASVLLSFATLLFSSQLALAQFTQQGPKLVGTGAVGSSVFQGTSVAMSGDGNTALVGGYYDNSGTGAVWVYTRSGGVWTQQGSKLVGTGGGGGQGMSVALSADGNTAIVGGPEDNGQIGAAWVFVQPPLQLQVTPTTPHDQHSSIVSESSSPPTISRTASICPLADLRRRTVRVQSDLGVEAAGASCDAWRRRLDDLILVARIKSICLRHVLR